ncbi:MAG TPA: hypothetical protein VF228_10745 [Iamia sp.]
MTHRSRRAALVLAAGVLLATTATACEPPGPPPSFTVLPAATGPDATPGDGVCATSGGQCSLQAAVEEANALDTPTDVLIPDGVDAAADLTVTGAITLVPDEDPADLSVSPISWTIAEGGQLTVTDAALGSVVVDGTLLARRVQVGARVGGPITGLDALVEVGATGTVLLSNVWAHAQGSPLLSNAGVVSLHGVTILPMTAPGGPTITTETGGQTRLSAVAVLGGTTVADTCAGEAPTSYGYNLVPDTTCGLLMEGDRQDYVGSGLTPALVGDARLDAIPVGTLHCGAGWDDDVVSQGAAVRPADSGEPGVAACDIGGRELFGTIG